jgi:uncharacterized protein (TIGR03067 family)
MYVRMLSVAVAVSVLAFVAAPHPRSKEEIADLNRMQGQWKQDLSWTWFGAFERRAVIAGDVFTVWEGDSKAGEWKLRLNASRSPRTFDAEPVGGGEPLFGIYEFAGDELRLRWANRRAGRPQEFAPEAGGASLTLTRPALRPCQIGDPVPSPLEPHGASIRVPMPPMAR